MRTSTLVLAFVCLASSIGFAAEPTCIVVTAADGTVWESDKPSGTCNPSTAVSGNEYHHLVLREQLGVPDLTHQHVIFSKEIDATTVDFWAAYNSRELLQSVVFDFFKLSQTGIPTLYYTVRLEGVRVAAIEFIDAEPIDGSPREFASERIRLDYQTITLIEPSSADVLLTNPNGPQ